MNNKLMTTDETEDVEFTRRIGLFRRNGEWMHAHGAPLYDQRRGRYIAVSQGEVFVADSDEEAARLAKEKHPNDEPFVIYIPKAKYERIYAYRGPLARV